jgi:2-polyprenyl-3-methyl-5-hydroxy-6-metoxy-1,4-benzoquinol methylase
MKLSKWDKYFLSHYRPDKNDWSMQDVYKYKQWYTSWVRYFEKKCPVLQEKASIFEIGSAMGSMAQLLHERGHNVIGSDISDLMVQSANQLCKPIRFVFCDIQKGIPLKKLFDIVLALEVLEHVPKLEASIKHIYASLRRGGYFVGTSPYPYKKNFLDPTHINVKYPDEWRILFEKNGFSDVKIYPMSFFPFLWRIHRSLNIVLPFKTALPLFISTTLIIAKK